MSRRQENKGFVQGVKDAVFGKRATPEEMAKKWKKDLRHEKRLLDRNIRSILREEKKVEQTIRKHVKDGEEANARLLARELVYSRAARERLYLSKAHLNSVMITLQQNMANYRLAKAMESSAQIMTYMNEVISVPELNRTMMVMAREMERAGLIEELVEEAVGGGDLVEEVDEEIEKIFVEMDLKFKEDAPDAPIDVIINDPVEEAGPQEDELFARYAQLNG
eukprot:TRINITY_DN2901_c0_g1_i2.p2 TRINITY_DN2901_c0_g1~~TRINITY_DN2901_c0_g1_i2.p2  ORF type:complete len:222 (-),score=78.74 TRINITY_DN2901_c0_g1_i2:1749-2414(-)